MDPLENTGMKRRLQAFSFLEYRFVRQAGLAFYLMDVGPLESVLASDSRQAGLLLQHLSPGRRDKALRFKPMHAKALCLGAGLLLDEGLHVYGLQERDMAIRLGENEKPFFRDYPELLFNLSHSGRIAMACLGDVRRLEWAEESSGGACGSAEGSTGGACGSAEGSTGGACGSTEGSTGSACGSTEGSTGSICNAAEESLGIGCDVQEEEPFRENLVSHCFHPDEQAFLASFEDEKEKGRQFTRIWSLKESFVKATGMGLAVPFQDFAVLPGRAYADGCSVSSVSSAADPQRIVLKQDIDDAHYLFGEIPVNGYAAAYCIRAESKG